MATTKTKAPAAAKPAAGDELELKDLRVIEFGVQNFMRVEAVVIRPDGASLIELTGKNRQGKTSVIRALLSVFTGKGALPSKPIRRGQVESRVWTILGKDDKPELTIEEQLTLKEDGDGEVGRKLVVTPADGRPYREPQALLNRLYAPIAFAPFEFSRQDPKKQLEVVKGLVRGFDFEANAARRQERYEDRTQVGRERDRAQARAAGIVVAPGTPAQEVDVDDLVSQLAEAREHNDLREKRRRNREDTAAAVEAKRDEIEQLQAKIATLIKEADAMQAKLDSAEPLPGAIALEPIEKQLRDATATNAAVRVARDRQTALDEHKAKEAEYAALTRSIDDLDQEKAAAIEAADLPIPGLELADEGLLLNGLPFDQASGREKLETAVRIGMAINPDLKLIVAEEGGLLDDEGLATLAALAEKFGFLVVIEKVTNGEKVGFCIEDGRLAP